MLYNVAKLKIIFGASKSRREIDNYSTPGVSPAWFVINIPMKKKGLKQKNTELNGKLNEATQKGVDLEARIVELEKAHQQELEAQRDVAKEEKDQLIAEVEKLKQADELKQKQLNDKELKRLAAAYGTQEDKYTTQADTWFQYLKGMVIGWGLLTVSIIFFTSGTWSEKLPYFAIEIIPISAAWFCVAEFSYYSKLRTDFANRKTIAQTYHNIVINIDDDVDEGEAEIKNKFIEKATDVLCAPSVVDSKEPILSKKVLKDLADIVRSIAPKG